MVSEGIGEESTERRGILTVGERPYDDDDDADYSQQDAQWPSPSSDQRKGTESGYH